MHIGNSGGRNPGRKKALCSCKNRAGNPAHYLYDRAAISSACGDPTIPFSTTWKIQYRITGCRTYSTGIRKDLPDVLHISFYAGDSFDFFFRKCQGDERLQSLGIKHFVMLFKLAKSARQINNGLIDACLLYTSPSPRDLSTSRMPSSA